MERKEFHQVLRRVVRAGRKAGQQRYEELTGNKPVSIHGSATFIISTEGGSGATRLFNSLTKSPFTSIYVEKLSSNRFRVFLDGIGGYDENEVNQAAAQAALEVLEQALGVGGTVYSS